MALRIACVGEIVEDVYIDDHGHEQRFVGGISANFARSAQAAGAQVTLFSAVGDDEAGIRLQHGWPAPLRQMKGPSAEQRIRRHESGERLFSGFRAGVLSDYVLTEEERAQVSTFDVVHLPVQAETRHLLDGLRPRRLVADFSIDSAAGDDPRAWLDDHLQRLDVAFIGGHARHLPALQALPTQAVLVLTCGADGAYAVHQGRVWHQPTVARKIVDTTGCGDAFAGAFTVSFFEGAELPAALRAGAHRAALVAGRLGAY